MKIEIEDIVTLRDLCKEFKSKKSTLNYYHFLGLITPLKRLTGNTLIFSHRNFIRQMKFIEKEKQQGKTLKEIARKIRINN